MSKFEVTDLELNEKIPFKYYPEWYKKGLQPIEVDQERLKELGEEMALAEKFGNKQQFKPVKVLDDDIPNIKPAAAMQDPKDSMWYDDCSTDAPQPNVNSGKKQTSTGTINTLRQKLLELPKEKVQELKPQRIAKPGECVTMLKGSAINIGTLKESKAVCEKIILTQSDLDDDDLCVFLRIPLEKLFQL